MKIATLGPEGTFSDVAARRYLATLGEPWEVEYFPSIKSALKAIGTSCERGVLPIENFSEGFIPLILDHLVDKPLSIVAEIILPVRFSFVGAAKEMTGIEKLFVQFVARGQCDEFIQSLEGVEVVTTESNMESLDRALRDPGVNGAIVPAGSFDPAHFPLVVENVNDYKNNRTRFLVFSAGEPDGEIREGVACKTSIIVLGDNDYPGLLSSVLNSFAKREINLTSIISRPTRKEFGKYHFFIDFDGHLRDPEVADALREISEINTVKILGSYPKWKME